MSVSLQKSKALLRKNAATLKTCRSKGTTSAKTKRCQSFAKKLMEYSRINHDEKCGFIGAGWGLNYRAHFGYCMQISATKANSLLNYNGRKASACRSGSTHRFMMEKCDYRRLPLYMKQIRLNGSLKCGYHGYKWNWRHIYSRCRIAYKHGRRSQNSLRRLLEKWDRERKLELEACSRKKRRCKVYADAAIKDVKLNQRLKCGHWGTRWHTHWNRHFDWCKSVPVQHTRNEANTRRRELEQCHRKRRR